MPHSRTSLLLQLKANNHLEYQEETRSIQRQHQVPLSKVLLNTFLRVLHHQHLLALCAQALLRLHHHRRLPINQLNRCRSRNPKPIINCNLSLGHSTRHHLKHPRLPLHLTRGLARTICLFRLQRPTSKVTWNKPRSRLPSNSNNHPFSKSHHLNSLRALLRKLQLLQLGSILKFSLLTKHLLSLSLSKRYHFHQALLHHHLPTFPTQSAHLLLRLSRACPILSSVVRILHDPL